MILIKDCYTYLKGNWKLCVRGQAGHCGHLVLVHCRALKQCLLYWTSHTPEKTLTVSYVEGPSLAVMILGTMR